MTLETSRLQQTLDSFNAIGETEQGMQRLAYTREEQQALRLFVDLCKKEQMTIEIDPVGNVIARRDGRLKNTSAVALGSHLDTVYTGGKYDGVAGVVAGLEVVRRLNEKNIMTDYPIELIAFTAEESSRFGVSTIGSKAMAGLFPFEKLHELKDNRGISLAEAMEQAGYDTTKLNQAKRGKDELRNFIELHIEQGPELEQRNKSIAITTGIAAPTRLHVNVKGVSSHSGTTSMERRKDALVAASELVLAIETIAKKEKEQKTVATVGVFEVLSGAMNVVPGHVQFKVDIRGLQVDSKQRIIHYLRERSEHLEQHRGVAINIDVISDEKPVLLDQTMQDILKQACYDTGVDPVIIPSGAGHDAMNMSFLCPTGLIFIPSRHGISHNPAEFSSISDLQKGVDVLERAVLRLANEETREGAQ